MSSNDDTTDPTDRLERALERIAAAARPLSTAAPAGHIAAALAPRLDGLIARLLSQLHPEDDGS